MTIALLIAFLHDANPDHAALAERLMEKYNIPPVVFHSVILVESGYNPKAVNLSAPVRSYGLTQLTRWTAHDRCGLEFKDIMNPIQNIECGAKVLNYQWNRYQGDFNKAIAAYNTGTYFPNKANGYVKLVKDQMENLCKKVKQSTGSQKYCFSFQKKPEHESSSMLKKCQIPLRCAKKKIKNHHQYRSLESIMRSIVIKTFLKNSHVRIYPPQLANVPIRGVPVHSF